MSRDSTRAGPAREQGQQPATTWIVMDSIASVTSNTHLEQRPDELTRNLPSRRTHAREVQRRRATREDVGPRLRILLASASSGHAARARAVSKQQLGGGDLTVETSGLKWGCAVDATQVDCGTGKGKRCEEREWRKVAGGVWACACANHAACACAQLMQRCKVGARRRRQGYASKQGQTARRYR